MSKTFVVRAPTGGARATITVPLTSAMSEVRARGEGTRQRKKQRTTGGPSPSFLFLFFFEDAVSRCVRTVASANSPTVPLHPQCDESAGKGAARPRLLGSSSFRHLIVATAPGLLSVPSVAHPCASGPVRHRCMPRPARPSRSTLRRTCSSRGGVSLPWATLCASASTPTAPPSSSHSPRRRRPAPQRVRVGWSGIFLWPQRKVLSRCEPLLDA